MSPEAGSSDEIPLGESILGNATVIAHVQALLLVSKSQIVFSVIAHMFGIYFQAGTLLCYDCRGHSATGHRPAPH
jgi:hypothetical protein